MNKVTLSFLISAWMVVVFLLVYYVAAYNPYQDPYRSTRGSVKFEPNAVDCAIYDLIGRIKGQLGKVFRYTEEKSCWVRLLHTVALRIATPFLKRQRQLEIAFNEVRSHRDCHVRC